MHALNGRSVQMGIHPVALTAEHVSKRAEDMKDKHRADSMSDASDGHKDWTQKGKTVRELMRLQSLDSRFKKEHAPLAHRMGYESSSSALKTEDHIRFVMPGTDPCWSLRKYINFALWITESAFTVDEAVSSPGSSHVVAARIRGTGAKKSNNKRRRRRNMEENRTESQLMEQQEIVFRLRRTIQLMRKQEDLNEKMMRMLKEMIELVNFNLELQSLGNDISALRLQLSATKPEKL